MRVKGTRVRSTRRCAGRQEWFGLIEKLYHMLAQNGADRNDHSTEVFCSKVLEIERILFIFVIINSSISMAKVFWGPGRLCHFSQGCYSVTPGFGCGMDYMTQRGKMKNYASK